MQYVPNIKRINMQIRLGEDTHINCLKDDIITVFTNIIVNAQQVMSDGGTITIQNSIENKMAVVRISDTGPGIPDELKTKIWDPFYTSNVGTHRGLGLSLVAKIMKDHKGIINFETELGKGTTFIIEFPIVAQ